MKDKVIIIGAGVGGLCTALRLLKTGFKVQIIEKNERVGGKVNILEEEGFKFDLTASILMNYEILEGFFNDLNLNIEDYIEAKELETLYRCFYHDGEIIDYRGSINKNITDIKQITEEDRVGYFKFLSNCYEKYINIQNEILSNKFENKMEFFNKENLVNLFKINPLWSSEHYMKKFIKDQRLIDFLCFQALYIGVSPYSGYNVYTMIPASTQVFGLKFIEGGMYKIIEVLESLVYEMGGDIKLGSEVMKIVHRDKKAVGVRLKDEVLYCDSVICNAEYSYAMENLVGGEKNIEEAERTKYSPSVFMMYIGLDKRYDVLRVHNHFFPKDFKESVEELFHGKLSAEPGIYVYCPSRVEGYLKDGSKECINAMIRVPNLKENPLNWDDDCIKKLEYKILERLKRVEGLEDIEEHMLFKKNLTPKYLESEFNAWKGSAFSVSHDINQMMYFRPHVRSKELEGLYFCGGSTHPGTGVTLVVMNSKIVEEIMLEDWKR